jgi:hypothetical protein
MGIFGWFDSSEAEAFGRELATYFVEELRGENLESLRGKAKTRAEKVMTRANTRIQTFRASHRLNFLQKSKLANTFLWSLKDGGLPEEVANQLTDWLTPRL